MTGGKAPKQVIRSTIGNVSDFANIDQARDAARKFVETMKLTRRNPNAVKREAEASELTISEVLRNTEVILWADRNRQSPTH